MWLNYLPTYFLSLKVESSKSSFQFHLKTKPTQISFQIPHIAQWVISIASVICHWFIFICHWIICHMSLSLLLSLLKFSLLSLSLLSQTLLSLWLSLSILSLWLSLWLSLCIISWFVVIDIYLVNFRLISFKLT